MDVVVVYESIYGNTKAIAESVAEGVRKGDPAARVTVLPVADAGRDAVGGASLVIVGGPTHILGMSRASSRRAAAEAARSPAAGDGDSEGVREWLGALPRSGGRARMAAAFDTRLSSRLAGGAARSIAKSLRRHGYTVVVEPEGFIVDESAGPLRSGERDRASDWGADLARRATD